MRTLSVNKYNEAQTQKWQEHYKTVLKEVNEGKRHLTELPQLATYLMRSDVHYGYVAFNDRTAVWRKSKKDAIEYLKTLN